MFSKIFVLLAVVAVSASANQMYTPCASGAPMPHDVRISGCDPANPPCHLVRGTDVIGFMDFTNRGATTQTLRPQVIATAFGIRAPYDLPEDRANACHWLENGACPITANEDFTYILSMPVLRIYPLVALTIEVSVIGDNGVVGCVNIAARTVDA